MANGPLPPSVAASSAIASAAPTSPSAERVTAAWWLIATCTAARTAGDLQPSALATAVNNTALDAAQTGRFRWRSWQDGKVRQSGDLGSRESLTLQYSRAYAFRQAATKGVYLDLCKVNADGTLASPLMQVVFKPDGSPADAGDIRIGNTSRTYVTHLSPLGAIDGPRLP